MFKDKKAFFFKSFFALIVIYITVCITIMAVRTDEDFSFPMGRYEEFNSNWYCENTGETFNCPHTFLEIESGEELIISKNLPVDLDRMNCIELRVFQGACKVYIDGELRQEYDDAPYRKYSKFPPSATVLVDLSDEDAGKEIVIKSVCENINYIGAVSNINIGEKDTIIRHIMDKYLPLIIVAIMLISFGILCIIVFYFLYRESKNDKYIVYLGMFITIMGLWIFTSSRLRQLFIGNITTVQYLELWLIHIMPIPFVFFCDLRCGGRYRKASNIMLSICYADFVITTFLHFTGIIDKAYTMMTGHVCLFLTAIYFIVCNVREYRTGYKKESIQIVFAFSFLMVLGFFDVIKLYADRQWPVGLLISVGVLGFAFMILAFSVQDYITESRAKMALIAESEAKDQFFATMSHDIRTPINAIIGMNEMIQREAKDDTTLEYARDVQRASETLMSIVNNILDFSKIRDGKYEIVKAEFLFSPMIADILKMTSALADNKGLKLITTIDENIPSGIIGDENAIKRVLTNLTSNAIKYTKEGSVEFCARLISSKAATNGDVCIRFEVKDTGIGIRKEDLPHIFDVFSRMDGEKNKNIQGTGLGLAITSALAASMDSEIIVSSVYGEGSVFSLDVIFPVYNAEPIGRFSMEAAKKADAENKIKEDAADKGTFYDETKKVLIVDDTAMNLKVMNKLLQVNGVNVTTAGSGDECIKYATENRFDIILLDDMMPGKDGRETLAELRNSNADSIKDVPVIALTANAGPGVRDMYIALGFTDYMSKPVSTDSLNKLLWTYLSEKDS